jgi:hypothetical protein
MTACSTNDELKKNTVIYFSFLSNLKFVERRKPIFLFKVKKKGSNFEVVTKLLDTL